MLTMFFVGVVLFYHDMMLLQPAMSLVSERRQVHGCQRDVVAGPSACLVTIPAQGKSP